MKYCYHNKRVLVYFQYKQDVFANLLVNNTKMRSRKKHFTLGC